MKALEREVIINEAAKVRPGTITRIMYKTECPVKAEYKKQGYRMVKVVETSARLGVNYHNIASVIARKAEEGLKETVARVNNYEWVLKNKVRHNTATGKDYLYAAAFNKGHHTYSCYILMTPDRSDVKWLSPLDLEESEYKDILIPSYWKKGDATEIRNISFENIYRIGSEGPGFGTLDNPDVPSLFS